MLIELLRQRRSVRQYESRPVEQEKKDILIEAMLRSPSSRSLNPWEFVVVDEIGTINALSKSKPHGATFLKNAPLAFVICGDPEKCDVWIEDCSIATLLLHLTAADLGLGSCWIQIRERAYDNEKSSEQYVKECLGLPDKLRVEAIVAVGYGKEEKEGHPASRLLNERVHFNKVG